MKKIFNWFGLLVIFLYIAFIIVAKLLGDKMEISGNIQIRNIFYAVALMLSISAFALLPVIWDRTLGVLLPLKFDHVILVDKSVEERYVRHGAAHHVATKFFLTFQFENGERKYFCVNSSAYESKVFFLVLPYESGKLCYKEQGKHLYFVSFTPDSTDKEIG
ncbi:MAG: DUF2500 domain-containing protein [Ruminococcaceae bacterium]|nr:DUF2500 domain-containing protein [Oscillospiraceae bacterium]